MAKLSTCRTCGYSPVATNAIVCPNCGRTSPAPGFFTRWISRLIVLALVGGAVLVAILVLSSSGS